MRTKLIFFLSFFTSMLSSQVSCGEDNSWLYIVEKMKINSKDNDYSPFYNSGKLYFVSDRESGSVVKYSNTGKGKMTDIYIAEKKSGKFSSAQFFDGAINSSLIDGPVSLTSSGQQLFFSGSERNSKKSGKKKLKIYFSVLKNEKWSEPEMLSFQKEEFNYCHPAISADGRSLVFSSDLSGSGGMDLFISFMTDGKWSDPVNAGKSVNSEKNDLFPFFGPDGNFYFSSDRTGNLDIFKCPEISSPDITRLSAPFNSSSDDFGFWTDSSGSSGYFSSNREGSDDNIYSFSRNISFSDCKPLTFVPQCYTFFEESAVETSDTLSMNYEWDFGDGTRKNGLRAGHCYSHPGKYMVTLEITDRSSSVSFTDEIRYEIFVEDTTKEKIGIPDDISIKKPFLFDTKSLRGLYPSVKTFYWEFSDGTYCEGDSVFHSFAAPGNYSVKILFNLQNSSGEIVPVCLSKSFVVSDGATGFNLKNNFYFLTLTRQTYLGEPEQFCILDYFPQIHVTQLW